MPLHARAKLDIDPWRHRKPESLRHLDQIKPTDIEHAAQAMTRISLQITLISVLGGLVEVVIGADELLELGLNVDDFFGGEVEFDEWHPCFFQVLEESNFARLEEH